MTEDTALECAILDILDTQRELYPSDLVDLLRERDGTLPIERTAVVLDTLFADRRIARLWHRYLLPRDIEMVRDRWLANIAHYGTRLTTTPDDCHAVGDAYRMLRCWDGWRLDTGDEPQA